MKTVDEAAYAGAMDERCMTTWIHTIEQTGFHRRTDACDDCIQETRGET